MIRRIIFRSFSFIHRLSQWSRKKMTSAGTLVFMGIIFSAVFGVDTRQTLSFQIFSLLLSLLLLSFLFSLFFRGRFSMQRELPEYCTVGKTMQYRVNIKNESRFTQEDLNIVEELDCVMPDFPEFLHHLKLDNKINLFDRYIGFPQWLKLVQFKRGASIKVTPIKRIPAKTTSSTVIKFIPKRRGYIHFKRSVLLRPDPFGLSNAFRNITQADTVLVLPKRYKVPIISLPGIRRYQKGGVNHAGSVGDSQEFVSLRDYRPGDPIKNIHWRSFAKQSMPVVKEYQDEFFVRMGMVLDTFIENKNALLFEEAVSVAASLIDTPNNNDSLLDLMFIGNEAHKFTSDRGVSNLNRMLEILACVNACYDKSFENLSSLVFRNIDSLSALMCIFLGWDHARQEFVKKIRALNIPVLVIVLEESPEIKHDAGSMEDQPHRFHVLYQNKVEDQLQDITF
jgi:uncharacterized protein (DUF58 family)